MRSQACKCLLSISALANVVYVCVCVMSLALSRHFTCHPAISLGSHLESEEGAVGREARCHVQRWGGSITALAALHLTNGLLLSVRDRPRALALTLAGCDTGPGVSRKHDTASTEPGRGGQETATEQPRPREHSGQLPLIPREHTGLQTFARYIQGNKCHHRRDRKKRTKRAEMGSTCRDKGMRRADLPC